jgi:hypothetical protein
LVNEYREATMASTEQLSFHLVQLSQNQALLTEDEAAYVQSIEFWMASGEAITEAEAVRIQAIYEALEQRQFSG